MSWLSDRLDEVAEAAGIDLDEVEALVDRATDRATAAVQAAVGGAAAAVLDVIDEALLPGESFGQIAEAAADAAAEALATPPARIDTDADVLVFGEHVEGRFEAFAEDDPDRLLEFSAVVDSRTSEACRLCDGVRLPASDPWWLTHMPPLHPNCRSTVMPAGGTPTRAPVVDAGEFGPPGWTPPKGI